MIFGRHSLDDSLSFLGALMLSFVVKLIISEADMFENNYVGGRTELILEVPDVHILEH